MKLRGDRIAVIGDLHGRWNHLDNAYFDRAGYDLLLFVGDLGSGTLRDGLTVLRQLARLRVPGLVMPGNNDAPHLAQLNAELAHQSGKLDILRLFGESRRQALEPCGYSVHELVTSGGPISLIAARPCSMGGSEFSFPDQIARNHGVRSWDDSILRLKELVQQARSKDLIFIAHNGPFGLGQRKADPWSRDFVLAKNDETAPRDWGDRDLTEAINFAEQQGKRVLAVIAGHMHRRPTGDARPLVRHRKGVSYVNAAVVPRIVSSVSEGLQHHHVELRLDPNATDPERRVQLEEHWVDM